MPILLQYGPIGAGAASAQNVAAEKERQIREAERLRREQAYEEQQRYDQEMALRRQRQATDEDLRRQELDIRGQSLLNNSNYRNDQLDVSRQRLQNADTPAERAKRAKDAAITRGDLEAAQHFHRLELQANQQDFAGNQGTLNRTSREDIANQTDLRGRDIADQNDRRARDLADAHNQLMRDLGDEKMKALQRAATARDEATRKRELTTAAQIDIRASIERTHEHWRHKPKPDPMTGVVDQNAMAQWTTEHPKYIEQERQAQSAADELLRGGGAPAPPPTSGPNPNFRRDTPEAFQNDPMEEGPVIGAGGAGVGAPPSMIQGQRDNSSGEFGGAIDPQMAAFMQFYNNLPPGSPYTAPDGSHRVKQ